MLTIITVIGEMQITATIIYHCSPVTRLNQKALTMPSVGKNGEKLQPICTGRSSRWHTSFGKQLSCLLLKHILSTGPRNPAHEIYPGEIKTHVHMWIFTQGTTHMSFTWPMGEETVTHLYVGTQHSHMDEYKWLYTKQKLPDLRCTILHDSIYRMFWKR